MRRWVGAGLAIISLGLLTVTRADIARARAEPRPAWLRVLRAVGIIAWAFLGLIALELLFPEAYRWTTGLFSR